MNSVNPMSDPFDVPAAGVVTPVRIQLVTGYEPDLFFDGDRFLVHLDRTYKSFDVATYSVSKSIFGPPLRRVNRLIHGLRQRGWSVHPKKSRFVENNHVKLFICYLDDVFDVYMGSQNLTFGTNLNIMMKARTEHCLPLKSFFESLWSNAI